MKPSLPQRLAWFLAGHLGSVLLRALYRSVRLEKTGDADIHGKIVGLWHQQFALFAPWCVDIGAIRRAGHPASVLVSDHRDGEYLARIIQCLGGDLVRGDSRRKPVAGLKAIVRRLREGDTGIFAMDGPVGPLRRIKPGIVAASLMTGKPIVLVFNHAERKWVLTAAWDHFFFPKPFSRAHIRVSPDWFPKPGKTPEENTADLEAFAAAEEARLKY
ncbi:MAG: DUF374 domain-containing protein [Spirochaetes bacterium]|nr:DUF374 domain-containing protein [Spirochaetota bacterium]